MRKINGLSSLLFFLPLFTEAGTLRFLNKQDPHASCKVEDLVDYCPDASVDQDALVAKCEGTHGLPASKCYMEYLCEHHDQSYVTEHKECIDGECPLSKRMPPLDCATYLGSTQDSTTDEPAADEEDSPSEGTGMEELINEQVEVEKPAAQEHESSSGGGGGKSHVGVKVFFGLGIPMAVAALVYFYRDKLLGGKENFPFDGHVENPNNKAEAGSEDPYVNHLTGQTNAQIT